MIRKLFLGITLCSFTQGMSLAGDTQPRPKLTAPKPAIAPVSWELKFRFEDPQRVSVLVPGKAEPVVYWYTLYTVENPGKREVEFYPRFELVTDTFKVVPSEIGVSPEAFRAVRRRAGNPLLIAPHEIAGRLQRGEDRARHGVAIWPDFDPKAKAFTLYMGGLSGEVTRWKNPAFDADKPENPQNKRWFILRKTLAIPYKLPGDQNTRTRAVPERITRDQKWVMR